MALRILDLLNFSNLRNPEGDSGIRLQEELIRAVLRRRDDFYFHLLIPHSLHDRIRDRFPSERVQLIPINSLSRQQGGAYHLDMKELALSLCLRQMDFDVLFLNQPELTAAFLHYFNKVHFFDVSSVGYIHWMDWKRSDHVKNRWNAPANLAVLTSILLSHATGCNSDYGRNRILAEAAKWFNEKTCLDMARRLIPLQPGVDVDEILATRRRRQAGIKTIIFPYRAQKYTGYKSLVEVHLAPLWRKRKDFRLIVTNPSDYSFIRQHTHRYPFLEVVNYDRTEYLRALWQADIVVGCHNGASQWSLALVEAVCAECIPLLNSEFFLEEAVVGLLPEKLRPEVRENYFYYRSNFGSKLEFILDRLDEHRKRFRPISQILRAHYDWNHKVLDWIEFLESADRAPAELKASTPAVTKLNRLLDSGDGYSKESILRHLNWHPKSRHISWTRYRKYLRQHYWEDPSRIIPVFSKCPTNSAGAGEKGQHPV